MFKKAFQVLQQIGRALMTPVAVLPAAGLLLRFGSSDLLNMPVVKSAGGVIFDNLPMVFAVGVAIGLAEGEGVAGLAAVIGYLILTKTLDNMGTSFHLALPYPGAIHLIDMGVFGGIIIGLVAALLYKRFHNIKLHPVLGFFAGKRFVPIITAVVAVMLGVVFSYVWPPVQHGIDAASNWVMNAGSGPFFFGFIQRLLIPFGLHHIFQTPFYFTMGSFMDNTTGHVVHGEMARYFAGDKTAGRFMAGLFPYMIFGLPAAALAMIHEARPERRKVISGLLISAALTSMLTGITEPIEFAFLFVAPPLFLVHAVLAGFSFTVMDLLHVRAGYTFSGGGIDYVLNYGLSTNGWVIIPFGLLLGVLYYFLFRVAIRKWNLKTPGRESDEELEELQTHTQTISAGSRALSILKAFGGKDNLTALDACITRLRITVKDPKLVSKGALKELGASGVLEVGQNFQAIFGTQSDSLKEEIKEIIRSGVTDAPDVAEVTGNIGKRLPETPKAEPVSPKISKGKALSIMAPLSGEIIDLTEVPDPVFAEKMMGDGFAIKPSGGLVLSPVKGTVHNTFPTKHALGLVSEDGLEILIHVGLDTVNLKGQGFELVVTEGDLVDVGTPILKVDLPYIEANAKSSITPIVFTNLQGQTLELKKGLAVAGETLVCVVQPSKL
jgi:glucose-specific phosphotransferase system IIBC component